MVGNMRGTRDNPRNEDSARACVFPDMAPLRLCVAFVALTLLCLVSPSEAQALEGETQGQFIQAMADEAGLDPGDFVATAVLTLATTQGYNLVANVSGATVNYGQSAGQNLRYLVDSADYPAWDSLDSSTQSQYGNRDNYDNAKFVSLMSAFGMEQEYTGFVSAGGGSFEFSSEASGLLQQFGNVGARWAEGAANAFGDLVAMVTNPSAFNTYMGVPNTLQFDASEVNGWPSSIPEHVNLAYQNYYDRTYRPNGSVSKNWGMTTKDVYWMLLWNTSNNDQYMNAFDDEYFQIKFGANSYTNVTKSGELYYYNAIQNYNTIAFSLPQTQVTSAVTLDDRIKAMKIILGNLEKVGTPGVTPNIDGYPEEGQDEPVDDEQPIYNPPGGLTPVVIWSDFTTQPPTPRPENPYNPDNQTDSDEWRQETEQNLLPLTGINFGDLFPFSLLADIPLLFDKVEGLTAGESASGVYNRVEIPFKWEDNSNENVVLDLGWLYSLLTMIRPAFQILLGAFLLITCIEFWRGILTG